MIPASARRASLASPELGNAAATSGSRTTTALPAAYLEEYLLREPRLKSYSGRISSTSDPSAPFTVLDDFFTISSLLAVAASSNDTLCLARFTAAFCGSQSNSSAKVHYTRPFSASQSVIVRFWKSSVRRMS